MEIINTPQNVQEPASGNGSSFYQSQPNPQVSQPAPQPAPPMAPVISISEWFVIVLLVSIPIVNIIFLCIWAFGNNSNQTKANFAKANLIWMAIVIALCIFFISSMMAIFMAFQQ